MSFARLTDLFFSSLNAWGRHGLSVKHVHDFTDIAFKQHRSLKIDVK